MVLHPVVFRTNDKWYISKADVIKLGNDRALSTAKYLMSSCEHLKNQLPVRAHK